MAPLRSVALPRHIVLTQGLNVQPSWQLTYCAVPAVGKRDAGEPEQPLHRGGPHPAYECRLTVMTCNGPGAAWTRLKSTHQTHGCCI